jgi:predicted negative regulator of RcsB-dependent stress response
MTDYNMTNKEEMDMIKRWWHQYGKVIAIAITIGLMLGFGWRYWRQHKVEQANQASVLFQKLTVADYQKKSKVARVIAAQLMQQYGATPYADLAAFWWAKQLVQEKNLQQAYEKYQWVLKHGRVDQFKSIARIRAARILLEEKKFQPALDMLSKKADPSFQPVIDEVKGDIYSAQQHPKAARSAYQSAKTGYAAAGENDPILTMKLAQ